MKRTYSGRDLQPRSGSPKRGYSVSWRLVYVILAIFSLVVLVELYAEPLGQAAQRMTSASPPKPGLPPPPANSPPTQAVRPATQPPVQPNTATTEDPFHLCCGMGELPEGSKVEGLRRPALVGIGQHKAGTSFLFNLLKINPAFLAPKDGMKELYTLGRWPLPDDAFEQYLNMWDQEAAAASPDSILYEVTASYMHIPGAACRMKKLLPDAKLVVVLRDPVSRALSHYNMEVELYEDGHRHTPPRPFADMITKELTQLRAGKCLFDGSKPQGKKSWGDCFKCWYLKEDPQEKMKLCKKLGLWEVRRGETPCNPKFQFSQFTTFGMLAPPIRWWLRFFPKDRFLFINNDELRTKPVEVANRVARFMGLPESFTPEMMEAHDTEIDGNLRKQSLLATDPLAAPTLAKLRDLYRPQIVDLYRLFDDMGVEFEEFSEWPRSEIMPRSPAAENSGATAQQEQAVPTS